MCVCVLVAHTVGEVERAHAGSSCCRTLISGRIGLCPTITKKFRPFQKQIAKFFCRGSFLQVVDCLEVTQVSAGEQSGNCAKRRNSLQAFAIGGVWGTVTVGPLSRTQKGSHFVPNSRHAIGNLDIRTTVRDRWQCKQVNRGTNTVDN